MPARTHQRRNREIGARARISANTGANLGEYKELWKIWKLQADPQNGGGFNDSLTQGDFVNKIFGNMTEGTNIVRCYLIPADEFVDPLTKQGSTLRLKNNGIPFIGDPDVDSFFSKFLWKGFLETYTPQIVEKERAMYFLTKEDPITDGFGKITNTEVFMMYASQNKKNQGNQKHTKITMSFIDSNVAKSSTGEMLAMEFYVKPTQPINVAEIEQIFKTNSLLKPRPLIVGVGDAGGDEEVVPKLDRKKIGDNILNWEFTNTFFLSTSISSFEIIDVLESERAFIQERASMEVIAGTGVFQKHYGIGSGENWGQGKFIKDTIYWNIQTETIGGIGVANFTEAVIDYFKSWTAGFGSQIPIEYTWTEDKTILSRTKANWIGTNTWILTDAYLRDYSIAIIAGNTISFEVEAKDNFTEEEKKTFIFNLLEGNASINGIAASTPQVQIIETNNSPNIEDLEEEGFSVVNAMGDMKSMLDPYTWIKKTINAGSDVWGTNKLIVPDPHTSFPKGGVILTRELFKDSNYSGTKFVGSTLFWNITSDKSEHIINSVDVGGVQGEIVLNMRDSNGDWAVGMDTEGNIIILPPLVIPSPQRFGAKNGRVRILFI